MTNTASPAAWWEQRGAEELYSLPPLPVKWNSSCVCAQQVSSLLLGDAELQTPASLTPARLAELSPFLPALGVPFLQALTSPQLLAALPALSSVAFSPAQVDTRRGGGFWVLGSGGWGGWGSLSLQQLCLLQLVGFGGSR